MSNDDRWLLPRSQTEYPARAMLPETTLHGRREATFLVLTALFFVASTVLVVLGQARVIDVSALLARVVPDVGFEAMLLPVGVVPFALSLVASALICELLGRRRAVAVVLFGVITSGSLLGLMWLCDVIDGGDAFTGATALAICSVTAHGMQLFAFELLRKLAPGRYLFARLTVAAWLSLALGWAAFAFAMQAGTLGEPVPADTVRAMALGSALYSAASVLVLAILAALVARVLAVALRVGPSWFDGSAGAEPDDEPAAEPAWAARPARYAGAELVPPYSSAELRFFHEGDEQAAGR